MAGKAQRNATRMHRRRAAARGLVRVEVQAAKRDAGLIRALATALRNGKDVKSVRSTLANALLPRSPGTAFDVFGSDLTDKDFAGMFDQPRQRAWRGIKL